MVECPDCGLGLAAGPLLTHLQEQHSDGQGGWGRLPLPPPTHTPLGEAHTYLVYFLAALMRLLCPVAGFQEGATNRTNLQVHFVQ